MNTERLTLLSALLLLLVTIGLTVNVLAVQPFGADYTPVKTERAPMDAAQDHEAIAGNVTELTVSGFSTTQSWQGYFGNVSGTIQLSDASDNQMYNWSLASPEGEIYATTIVTVNWTGIACFDLATNHEALEGAFGIASDDVDAWAHDEFFTNNVQFEENECPATSIYDGTGGSVDNNFEEVLLTDGSANDAVIFTSILDEEDVAGFDGAYHDFEMLVLDDGHGTDTVTTTYYFYVELE